MDETMRALTKAQDELARHKREAEVAQLQANLSQRLVLRKAREVETLRRQVEAMRAVAA